MREGGEIRLVGRYGLARRDRETGKIEWGPFDKNTITTFGKGDLLDIITGVELNRYATPNLRLHSAADGGGSVLFTTSTQVATYPQLDGSGLGYAEKIIWSWEDVSDNEYDPRSVTMRRGTSSNFSVLNINGGGGQPEWGAKTDRYNWIFYYELSFGGSVNIFGDGGAWHGGLAHAASLMIQTDTYFDDFLNLKVEDQGNTIDAELVPAEGPDRTGSTVEWLYTAGLAAANFQWYWRTISIAGNPILRVVGDSNLGTKASNQIWHYTYSLSIS